MHWFKQRFDFLFRSTKGLALMVFALVSLTLAWLSTLSGPMREWGITDTVVSIFKIQIDPALREGRIVMLYHSLAMAMVALEVYFITGSVKMKAKEQAAINTVVTLGYIISLVFGLLFGYFGRNYFFHHLFLCGLTLMFAGGVMLTVALWPWRKEYRVEDPARAHTTGGFDLERMAFFFMAAATLISACCGALPGMRFGDGFNAFLAEDLARQQIRTPLQLMVIGHLHIMLTLIVIAAALLVGRWMDFKGTLHKAAMPLMIAGTLVVSLGSWSVVAFRSIAHKIIYAGSSLVLLAGLLLVIFIWDKLIREGTSHLKKPSGWQKFKALISDPLKFGAGWQMVFMNFTTTFVGIYMAVRLDEIFRQWPVREERISLTGHWHILATITATILLLYFADLMGMKGNARRWFGWVVIIFSDLAFAAATLFEIKRLLVSETTQQPLVNVVMTLIDMGLAALLTALAVFMFWRLFDLFTQKGRWFIELEETFPKKEQDPN